MAATEPRSASELVSLLLELARVVKARRYFEAGDARLAPLFEHARRVWVADLARYGPLELIVQADHIVQGDQSFAIDGRLEATLDEWRARGVGRLSVEPDIDGDALAGLVEVLAMPEQNVQSEGGAGLALARRVPFGLVIEPAGDEAEKDLADTDVLALRSPAPAEPESAESENQDSTRVSPEAETPSVALSRHAARTRATDSNPRAQEESAFDLPTENEPSLEADAAAREPTGNLVGADAAAQEPTGNLVGADAAAREPTGNLVGADAAAQEPNGNLLGPDATGPEPSRNLRDRDTAEEEGSRTSDSPSVPSPIIGDAEGAAETPTPAGTASRETTPEGVPESDAVTAPTMEALDDDASESPVPAVMGSEAVSDRTAQDHEPVSTSTRAGDPAASAESTVGSQSEVEPAAATAIQSETNSEASRPAIGLRDADPAAEDPSETAPDPSLDIADPDDEQDPQERRRIATAPTPDPDIGPADDEEDTDVVALRTPPDPATSAATDVDPPSGLSDSGRLRWPQRMLKAAAHRSRALAERARGADDATADLAESPGDTEDTDEVTAPNLGKGLAGRLLAGLRSGSDTEPLPGDGSGDRGIADEDTLPVRSRRSGEAEPFLNPSDAAASMLRELENASDPATYAELTDSLVRLVEAEYTSLGTAATLRILSSLAVECDAKRGESERVTAETAIRRLAEGEVQDALFDQASDAGTFSEAAGRILQKLGPDIASPLIDYALTEPEAERFAHLAEHFGNLEPSYTTTPVLAALGRSERQEVLRAIRLAERHPSLEATGRMADLLRSEDEFIREGAARALARRASPEGGDDPQALRGLARGLQSTDPTLTVLCAECLSATGSPRAVPPLAASMHAAVEARELDTARERIRALGDLGRGEAAAELGKLLLTRDWLGRKRLRELKLAACKALGRLPGDEAVGVLSQAAQLRDAQLRESAQTALDRRKTGRAAE